MDKTFSGILRFPVLRQVRVIHETIHKSIEENGWDRDRPLPGICIHYKTPGALKLHLAHNIAFTDHEGNTSQRVRSGPGRH